MSTAMNDFKNNVLLSAGYSPALVEESDSGSGIDLVNADGNCFAVQSVGAVGGTSPTLAGKIQESADNSSWSDISGASFSTVSTSNNLQTINFQRAKRYVRYVATVTGTNPSYQLSVLIGQQKKTI